MDCQKHLFSLRDDLAYLNCASKAPLLKSSELAGIKALQRERNPVDIKSTDFFEEAKIVRQYFGKLINADPAQIAVVPSVSYGMSSILSNTSAKEDGNAITVSDEFPSGYFALKKWCSKHRNEMVVVEPDDGVNKGTSWNENILSQINPQTSIVLISSVHWMNGVRFDLEAIGNKCLEYHVKLIVDGTQSVGAIKMDVKKYKIDALLCAGYKWLLGPYSISMAYFSKDYNNGRPIEESWMNRVNANEFHKLTNYEENYKPGAQRYNVGETSNFILMPMLMESLRQVGSWGPQNIQNYCKELIKPLNSFLERVDIGFEQSEHRCSHLFALKFPDHVRMESVRKKGEENNISVSIRGSYVRVSVNVFNDESDITRLMEFISDTLDMAE